MAIGQILAAILPSILGSAVPAYLGYQADLRRAQMEEERARQERERYERSYNELLNMLSGVLDPSYSAVSRELIDQLVGRAAADIARAQERQNEAILREQARRGLAGHSLVDRRQAYVDERAQEALANARLQAELNAANLTEQQRAQARSILAGVTADNMRAAQAAAQNLLNSYGQAADTYSLLAGTMLGGIDWNNLFSSFAPTSAVSQPRPTAALSIPPGSGATTAASAFSTPTSLFGGQPTVAWADSVRGTLGQRPTATLSTDERLNPLFRMPAVGRQTYAALMG